eukprot:SAG31_NODE_2155_length_6311_cov_3.139086_2_plen_427_part_00
MQVLEADRCSQAAVREIVAPAPSSPSMEPPQEISGLELAEAFYTDVVGPLLRSHAAAGAEAQLKSSNTCLKYAAALIGPGSEVLGFDDATSRDHDWGPRLQIFLAADGADPAEQQATADGIARMLRSKLPAAFRGYSTHFEDVGDDDPGVALLAPGTAGNITHRVKVSTLSGYLEEYLGPGLGVGPGPGGWRDWLRIPAHKLRTVGVGGRVFCDDTGELTAIRALIGGYYPKDVWLFLLHAGYSRLGQLSHFMGRCGQAGDELGSRLIAAQLVHDIMSLCFLLERQYAPYAKWFGKGFSKLACAPDMTPLLSKAMDGGSWEARDAALGQVYNLLGELLNSKTAFTGIPAQTEHVVQFWTRPFQVPNSGGWCDGGLITVIASAIEDAGLRQLCERRPVGNAEQHFDSTEVLEDPSLLAAIGDVMYRL